MSELLDRAIAVRGEGAAFASSVSVARFAGSRFHDADRDPRLKPGAKDLSPPAAAVLALRALRARQLNSPRLQAGVHADVILNPSPRSGRQDLAECALLNGEGKG